MAQPSTIEVNGVSASEPSESTVQAVMPGKRKRDEDEGGDADVEMNGVEHHDEQKPPKASGLIVGDSKQLAKAYYDLLKRFDIEPSILKRPLPDLSSDDEPYSKRQKSSEPPSISSISDKVAANAYSHLQDMADDVLLAVKASLSALESQPAEDESSKGWSSDKVADEINSFKTKAMEIFHREQAYPRTARASVPGDKDDRSGNGEMVLSLIGYAPQERRLFSSLPFSSDESWTENNLPTGVSASRIQASHPQEKTQTLGELFAPPRTLPPLQPPKQPKTHAKGNVLDFYHPELADITNSSGTSYFTTRLPAGHYLDYSHATPSWQSKTKRHERAQSLAGKKPSSSEVEASEMDALFRGAFSSFAPSKDDSSSLVPTNVAGKVWWQRAGQKNFDKMIEVEYYNGEEDADMADGVTQTVEVDDEAIQDAIDNWDDTAVDPSLEDVMGSKRDDSEKEVDEILDEVSDMIETLASFQRIRNLNLPNSQNRQSSDPVAGDMLANSGPQPSEEEQATYQMLKAQLALIVKTLPPYAVAKLNGDQLDDLLISTKVQVQTDQYKGTMEEDEAGVQARIRAQQQQQQQAAAAAAAAAAAQSTPRPPSQRTPSISSVQYPGHYQAGNQQYGTPNRTPSHPQQYYRPQVPTPQYPQQSRSVSQPQYQHRPAQPHQYSRPNGYPNQYATQLAKAQTPYGHQNMQQYAGQQRPQQQQQQYAGQMPQQANQNARYQYQHQGFPQQHQPHQQQQPGTPSGGNYGQYTNGAGGVPGRTMSPQVHQQGQAYSPSPNMQHQQQYPQHQQQQQQQQQQQRYGTPNQAANSQMNRYPGQNAQQGQSNPGLTGYHTVIPEAQQQRILDQARARVAAQERSASFGDKISQPGYSGTPGDNGRPAAASRGSTGGQQQKPGTPTGTRNGTPTPQHIPHKITPVPLPAMPGSQPTPPPQAQQQPPPPPPQQQPGQESPQQPQAQQQVQQQAQQHMPQP